MEMAYPEARKRYVDNSKVVEHYALVPTKQTANIGSLNEKEKNIYQEVVATTLAMFAPDYEYEETKVEIDVNGICFEATGKVEKNKGWRALFATQNDEEKETVLPSMREGESCQVDINVAEGKTKAPKHYTEGQLINVMKHAGKEVEDEALKSTLKASEGIGTEATRASIIETLKHQKYIVVRKNKVTVTDKGKVLCQAVDRKSTRLNSSHVAISYAVFCLKKKIQNVTTGKRKRRSAETREAGRNGSK